MSQYTELESVWSGATWRQFYEPIIPDARRPKGALTELVFSATSVDEWRTASEVSQRIGGCGAATASSLLARWAQRGRLEHRVRRRLSNGRPENEWRRVVVR